MSILFTGNCYFESAAVQLPAANAEKTVCFWLQATDLSNVTQSVFNATNSTLGTGYQIGLRGRDLSVWNFGGTVLVKAQITTDWTHVAYTYDGTHRLFFNGLRVDVSSTPAQSGPPLLCQIGSNQWDENLRNGQVEDIRVYSRALSPNELLTIASSSASDDIVYRLVARWPCGVAVENRTITAQEFIEDYGTVSTVVGTIPLPSTQGSRMTQRRA